MLLRAKTFPRVPQIVWYVDGEPFALTDPDRPVTWPLSAGEHRFQIGLPLRSNDPGRFCSSFGKATP